MDPTKLRNWALAATACAAVAIPVLAYGKRLVAQEARKEAAAQFAPATEELSQIKDLLRRQEDRDAFRTCVDYKYQDQPREVRLQMCERESNARWTYWTCEDETPKADRLAKCEPKP